MCSTYKDVEIGVELQTFYIIIKKSTYLYMKKMVIL